MTKRPPVRRRFVIEIGQRGLGSTSLLITTEDGRQICNAWCSSWHTMQLGHVLDLIERALRFDLEERPPRDRRGRAPWAVVDHTTPILEALGLTGG